MEEINKLNSDKILAEIGSMTKDLNADNEKLRQVDTAIDNFINSNIKSKSFDDIKEHMSNYKLLITSQIEANNSDIRDCNTLRSAVGRVNLDGANIWSAIRNLREQRELADSQRQRWQYQLQIS